MKSNTSFLNAVSRANSHIRYWRYRKSIGRPISLTQSVCNWYHRFVFEAFGIGSGV